MAREARRFVEFVHARSVAGGSFISKLEAKEIGRACGVRTIETLAVFDRLDDIVALDFSAPFVLKATHLASKHGVCLITNVDGGRFYEEFTKRWLSLEELRSSVCESVVRDRRPERNKFIVEEFIRGANSGVIPFDYKMYTIDEEVLFMLQVDRNIEPNAMAFFGQRMSPLVRGRDLYTADKYTQFGAPEIPANWQDMEETARRIARHLKTPFISVDVYTDGRDVILGDLTTVPGGPYYGGMFRFLPDFDQYLGERWRKANERLGLPIPTISSDPPCLISEADFFSGRLEASLRKEIAMLRHELRKARKAAAGSSATAETK